MLCKKCMARQAATSRDENSAQGSSCQLKFVHVSGQGILKGEVSLYHWPPFWLVWNQLYDNWQFLFWFLKTDSSKPVKQEVNGTVILPLLVLPDRGVKWGGGGVIKIVERNQKRSKEKFGQMSDSRKWKGTTICCEFSSKIFARIFSFSSAPRFAGSGFVNARSWPARRGRSSSRARCPSSGPPGTGFSIRCGWTPDSGWSGTRRRRSRCSSFRRRGWSFRWRQSGSTE